MHIFKVALIFSVGIASSLSHLGIASGPENQEATMLDEYNYPISIGTGSLSALSSGGMYRERLKKR